MVNFPEIAIPRLNREASKFVTCLYTVELPIKIGPIRMTGTFHIDQFFGTDAIMRTTRPSSRTIHRTIELLVEPHLVLTDSDYLLASNVLLHSRYGPLTGYSEALFFPVNTDTIHSIENLFATREALADIDGWFRYRLNLLKGIRPKSAPTHHLLLNSVSRDIPSATVNSIHGTISLSEERVLSLTLDYRNSSFSLIHHHLTGCLPKTIALDLIQEEEAKSPELRLSRFLADLWTISDRNLGYYSEAN